MLRMGVLDWQAAWGIGGVVCALVAGAGCGHVSPAMAPAPVALPSDARPLAAMPTVFVRIHGEGRLPLLRDVMTYELCVDGAGERLLDVRDPESHASLDDVVPNVLRSWRWQVHATERLGSGVICWQQHFVPERAGDGRTTVRTEVGDAKQGLALGADDDERLYSLSQPREDGDAVNAIRIVESGPTRFIYLTPRLRVIGSAEVAAVRPSRRSEVNPHLRDSFRLRHSHGIVVGEYWLCVDREGAVSVQPDLPILGANHGIVETIRAWRFDPPPREICDVLRLVYELGG
jgi:hypothetical protein